MNQELRKRKSKVAVEKIEAMAEDGIQGIRNTQKILGEEEKEAKKQEAWELERLHSARTGKIVTYTTLLAKLFLKRLYLMDWPLGWKYEVAPTDIGIIFEMRSPQGRIFRSAFKATGMEHYDLNAIDTLVMRAENTMERTKDGQTADDPKNHRT